MNGWGKVLIGSANVCLVLAACSGDDGSDHATLQIDDRGLDPTARNDGPEEPSSGGEPPSSGAADAGQRASGGSSAEEGAGGADPSGALDAGGGTVLLETPPLTDTELEYLVFTDEYDEALKARYAECTFTVIFRS